MYVVQMQSRWMENRKKNQIHWKETDISLKQGWKKQAKNWNREEEKIYIKVW